MDIRALKAFVDVASHGSYARAAVALDVAQSALSRKVAAFEAEIGGRLFHRTGRGVVLTELGERMLPRGRALISEAAAFEQTARARADVPTGEVTLGLVPVASRSFVAPLAARLRDSYPGIHLRVLEGYSGQVQEWHAGQRVDVAIYNQYQRSRVAGADLLLRTEMHLIVRSNHRLARTREVTLRALAGVPLVLPARPNSLTSLLTGLAAAQNMELAIRIEANATSLIGETIRESDLAGISPVQVYAREIVSGEFAAVRIVRPNLVQTTWMAVASARPMSRAAEIVVRLIRDAAASTRARNRL